MTVTLDRPLTTEPPTPSTPDALDVVRRARRAPVRRHRRLARGPRRSPLVGAFAARVLLGDYTVTVPDFVRILGGEQIPGATFILMESKLPRAVLAVLVGVAFGVGGAIFQTTLRNPLASPDIVGVSLGASAAAVSAIALAGWTGWPVSAAADRRCPRRRARRPRWSPATTAASASSWPASASPPPCSRSSSTSSPASTSTTSSWCCAGSPAASTASRGRRSACWRSRWPCCCPPPVGWPGRCASTELGDDTAAGLGVGRGRTDLLMLLGVLLVAVAVAAAGPVAFVAFLSGPIARALNQRAYDAARRRRSSAR